jgi:replication factor C subunit 3/5
MCCHACSCSELAVNTDLGPTDALVHCRAVIEKYTRSTRFCLICNYVSKIIPALQSRCTRFRFPPLPEPNVRERVQHVAECEK